MTESRENKTMGSHNGISHISQSIYCKTSNIRCIKSQNLLSRLAVASAQSVDDWRREWKCSWSSADGWWSNYIWVINNFIACWDMSNIRGLTVIPQILKALRSHLNIFQHNKQKCASVSNRLIWYHTETAGVALIGVICHKVITGLCINIKTILDEMVILHLKAHNSP